MALTLAAFTWGASFVNTINVGYPLDNLVTYSESREGSKQSQSQSGIEDAWTVGVDYILQCDVRWIPLNDVVSPLATGWDGLTGFRAFLEWGRDKQVFRFIPDRVSAPGTFYQLYLVEPMQAGVSLEMNGTRKVSFKARGSAAFSGV